MQTRNLIDKEKSIIESFAKTFNKIKRIDENEINEFEEENPLYSRQQQNKNAYHLYFVSYINSFQNYFLYQKCQ